MPLVPENGRRIQRPPQFLAIKVGPPGEKAIGRGERRIVSKNYVRTAQTSAQSKKRRNAFSPVFCVLSAGKTLWNNYELFAANPDITT